VNSVGVQFGLSWHLILLLLLRSLPSRRFRGLNLLFLGHLLCLRGVGRAWLGDMDVLRRGRLGGVNVPSSFTVES
jgi:hypothetical protein